MIRSSVSLPAILILLSLTNLVACTVMVKEPPRASARGTGTVHGHGHGHRHGHGTAQSPGATPPSACAVHTGTGCYWMENNSGHYCWVPADWAATFEECHAMDSCDGGKGESNGGCYKWATSSTADRSPWPNS